MSEPWEESDDGSHVFDFDEFDVEPGLAALDHYVPALDDRGPEAGLVPVAASASDEADLDFLFSAGNPAQTVTVTTMFNGTVQRVELSPRVAAELSEAELAAEVVAVSEVAAMKAQSGQYELISELLRIQGQDRGSIRDLLEHTMRLPTPNQAWAAEAQFNVERIHGRVIRD